MKKANYVAGAFLLIFGALILIKSLFTAGDNEQIGEVVRFPIIISVLLIAGSIALILLTKFGPELGKVQFKGSLKEVLITMAIMLLVFPLLKYFGFVITTLLMCFSMLRLLGNSYKTSIIAAVLITVTVYVLFHFALNVNLPKGLIMRKIL